MGDHLWPCIHVQRQYVAKPTRSTQPCIPMGRYIEYQPLLAGVKVVCHLCWVAGNTVWSSTEREFL